MIELGDTVIDTKYDDKKLVVGKTLTLEAAERLPKRFVAPDAKIVEPVAPEEIAPEEPEEKEVVPEEKPEEDEIVEIKIVEKNPTPKKGKGGQAK